MKARVVVVDGKVAVMVDEGSFADGKERIDALLLYLQAAGVELDDITPVEAHRDEDDLLHELSHITQ